MKEEARETLISSEYQEKTLREIEDLMSVTGIRPLKQQPVVEETRLISHESHATVFQKP
jgi:hypothetical protein